MSDRTLIMDAIDRIEAARLRLSRNGKFATKDVVEILEAIPAPVVASEKEPEEENLLTKEIIAELKRLTAALERPSAQLPPTVNVSPTPVSITTPPVSVQPNVMLNTPRKWLVNVTEHFTAGPMYGKVKQVEFIAL